MDDWAKRSHIPLTTVDVLSGSYARSHLPSDPRILFSLETSSIWRSSVGLPAGPALRLQLPMVFHSDIFESVRKIWPPITDILNLVQCLLTGIVTLVFEENLPRGIYRTTRGLPPVSWINANEQMLQEIFGVAHYRALHKASSDTAASHSSEI
ncbi:hypothetical protein B0H11DRAFT_2163585 [Mycena galericulata]|nr:hypothetical protein B0H11DRAFT_2163585 [Mycena galericulata]